MENSRTPPTVTSSTDACRPLPCLRVWCLLLFALAGLLPSAAATPDHADPWSRTPWSDPTFFPIAVWLQNPSRAADYRQAGINTYVGLWKGPTREQLDALQRARMWLICDQNTVALAAGTNSPIIGWMHGDEPDNAQSLGEGKGYGPPIPPATIVADYQRIRSADPTRPVLLNLGQGVAWDPWIGRGVRRNHPEDYPEYVQGCDLASFDIYPAVHDHPEVAGNLWFVARGVERLVGWAGSRPVWNCLECTRISNPDRKPTPAEVRCEAWMALIHGSRGLIYFVHQFKPTFREAALLDEPEMLTAVTRLNREITDLAPVLNQPSLPGAVRVTVADPACPVAAMVKKTDDALYVFAVAMRGTATRATFQVQGAPDVASAEVLGEDRRLPFRAGAFEDRFEPWAVHGYRIRNGR